MHVFDVGLFQTHCWQVWGIDTSNPGGDGMAVKTTARPPDAELEKWYGIIRAAQDPGCLRDQLNRRDCACDMLWHICCDHNLRRAGNKLQLATAIAEWSWTQRKNTSPEMIKLPTVHPADQRHHTVATPFSASETDVESQNTRKGALRPMTLSCQITF
ncbi:hypothetical protein EI94DRAFT_1705061 [Lactarius quietus]|nr:hypothetical protein EI94DRAFT_1705061 [Lactarius quietus]